MTLSISNCSCSTGGESPYCQQHKYQGMPEYIRQFLMSFVEENKDIVDESEVLIHWNRLPNAPTFEAKTNALKDFFSVS